ncbi:MAG: hypothetical protein WA162_07510 [Thermodesulfobacteriota bacterium]
MNIAMQFVSVISRKALLADAVLGLIGAAACALINKAAITGFIAGFLVGALNQYLYFSAAGKTAILAPDKAAVYAVSRFYARFFLSAIMLAVVTWKFSSGAWAVLAGFMLTFLITITTAAIALREEAEKPCIP